MGRGGGRERREIIHGQCGSMRCSLSVFGKTIQTTGIKKQSSEWKDKAGSWGGGGSHVTAETTIKSGRQEQKGKALCSVKPG